MAEPSGYFPPLRSALKQSSSRPSTPGQSVPGFSPAASPVPLPPLADSLSAIQSLSSSTTSASAADASSSSRVSSDGSPAPFSPSHTPSSLYSTATATAPPLPLPATPGYKPKVSFDTFENPAASMFSFTLQVHSHGFVRTKDTRTYLCAASADPSGRQALAWALEGLIQDGDELIVFRGFDADVLERDHDLIRNEARDFIAQIQSRCVEIDPSRKVSITIEFIAGKITQTIDRLIALYRPDSLVVGTRGPRGMMQTVSARFGATAVGGVSKYCLSHSPVPVIVVRPENKVRKARDKRRADPKRGTHFDDVRSVQSPPSAALAISPSTSPSSAR